MSLQSYPLRCPAFLSLFLSLSPLFLPLSISLSFSLFLPLSLSLSLSLSLTLFLSLSLSFSLSLSLSLCLSLSIYLSIFLLILSLFLSDVTHGGGHHLSENHFFVSPWESGRKTDISDKQVFTIFFSFIKSVSLSLMHWLHYFRFCPSFHHQFFSIVRIAHCLSVCMSVCPSVCMSVCLSIYTSESIHFFTFVYLALLI